MKVDQLHVYDSGDDDDDLASDFHEETTGSKPEGRKSNKPIMEKRRRARINNCLGELKGILLEAMCKDPARHSKLEKADILELTVRHLQNIQRNQLAIAMATDPTVVQRFKNGFAECATEVSRYLGRLDGVESGMRSRVNNHLGNCVNGLQQVGPTPTAVFAHPRSYPSGTFQVMPSPIAPPAALHIQATAAAAPPTMGEVMSPAAPPLGLVMTPDVSSSSLSSLSSASSSGGGRGSAGIDLLLPKRSSERSLAFVSTPRRPPTPPRSPPARRLSLDAAAGERMGTSSEHVKDIMWRPW